MKMVRTTLIGLLKRALRTLESQEQWWEEGDGWEEDPEELPFE